MPATSKWIRSRQRPRGQFCRVATATIWHCHTGQQRVTPLPPMTDFSDDLRRRPRLKLLAGSSVAAALVLTATGGMASSKATMLVAGVAWLVASVCVHRLQADGWVGPEI